MSSSAILDYELLRRIFGNVGAVPGENFGKAGLVTPECSTKTISVQLEDESTVEYHIWSGQIPSLNYKAAITNIATKEEPGFLMALSIDDNVVLGFRMLPSDWDFLQKRNDGWTPVTYVYKLNLAIAFELITQEGMLWLPNTEPTESLLASLESLVEY